MRSACLYLLFTVLCFIKLADGFSQQLKLGRNPSAVLKSAVLELESPNQGLLLPRLNDTAGINSFSPPDGMVIYLNPAKQLYIRTNGGWSVLNSGIIDTSAISNFSVKVRGLFSAGTGIVYNSATGVFTNSGVTSLNGNTGALTLDTNYIANFYQKSRGLLSAGTGITYNSTTGVISNSAPDQTVALTGGTGISVSGTYPNFTITNSSLSSGGTVTNVSSANANATVTNNTTTPVITINAAPKLTTARTIQGVSFDGSANINVINGTGFVKSNGTTLSYDNSTYLTSVDTGNIVNFYQKVRGLFSATSPITLASNGAIGITQASATTPGYLSAADWSTFNSKGGGSVTSVSVTTANGVSGTVTNPTTTPAISLTLGAITPTSVAATGTVTGSNLSGTNTGNVTLGTANGLSLSSQVLSLGLAGTSATGALSSSDWNTFNTKLSTVDTGNIANFYLKSRGLLSAGTGITYNSTTGVITNSAPDQAVSLTGGTGISVSGTYPNFTVTNTSTSTGGTVTNVTSANTNATVTNNTTTPVITINAAPKLATARTIQGVSFDGSANINIINGTGFVKSNGTTLSYDNSTYLSSVDTGNIANFYQKVRGLFSATAPITLASNGAIGITQASATTPGYLSAADWTTFNNKLSSNNVWTRQGNAGTNAGTDFIGTTDNQDLIFKTNSTERWRIENSTGDIKIGSATSGTFKASQELVMRQDGDTYGSSILRLRNRNGENGAIFETTDPSTTLVDFIFKTAISQRNIRYEGRSTYNLVGIPAFHIGGSNPDLPNLAIGDNYSAFSNKLKIGSYATATEVLDVVGNVKFSGALMPGGLAGTSGYILKSNGANAAPTWINHTLDNLSDVTISATPSNGQVLQYNGTNWVNATISTGSGTVTNVTSSTTAATVTNNTTTPVITINSAPKLTTARTIQGVSFDGSANINIINGTGFVKSNGTTLSYDNSTYLTSVDTGNIANFSYKVRSRLSAGTGITYNDVTGVISNSAPDQTVALTGGTGISVSGTYPNFTITNTGSGGGSGSGWGLTGNSGTNASNNFIGTTDGQALVFKTNNTQSGYIGTSNTSPTAFGYNASAVSWGNSVLALGANSSAGNNYATAIGGGATAGSTYGTAIGYNAKTGQSGVAIGASTDGTGANNTIAIGYTAKATSQDAIAIGDGAQATTSNETTAIGNGAKATGYQATALGTSTTASYQNSTAIGNGANVSNTNTIRLGNSAITRIEAAVTTISSTSDKRFKTGIQENVPGLDFILKLKPVTYHFNIHKLNAFNTANGNYNISNAKYSSEEEQSINEKEAIQYSGFLAQDVEKAANEVGYDFSGLYKPKNNKETYALGYSEFVVPLVKAAQELNKKNEELNKKLEDQQKTIDVLIREIEALKKNVK